MEGRQENSDNRKYYIDIAVMLFCLAVIFILSSILATFDLKNLSILTLLTGLTLFRSFLIPLRRLFDLVDTDEERSPGLMIASCFTIATPIGLVCSFIPFVQNMNMFFPAFSIIAAIVIAVVAWVFSSRTLWLIFFALMSSSIYSISILKGEFDLSGLFTGAILCFLAATSYTTGIIINSGLMIKIRKSSYQKI